jgi:CRP-like cAMP-binding protein
LDKTLRDAIALIKELQNVDKIDSSMIDRFQEILFMTDSSLIKLGLSNSDVNFNEAVSDGDFEKTPGLFSNVPAEVRAKLDSIITYKNYSDGDIVIREGEVSDKLHVIEYGRVVVYIDSGHRSLVLSTLSSGDFFGEMALLTGKPRSASVRALCDLVVLVIRRDDLINEIYEHPEIIREFTRQLEARIRRMKKFLHMK